MGRLLIIGCGGVAGVAIHKCCQNSKTFTEICIASRTKSKCDALKEKLEKTTDTVITTAQVDADNTEELIALIKKYQPDAVLNVALPYQDLTIMSRRIRMTKNGVPSMKNAVKKRDLQHILTIPGSGHTVKNSKRQELRHCLEAGLIRE